MTQLLRKRQDANNPELASSRLVITELAADVVILGGKKKKKRTLIVLTQVTSVTVLREFRGKNLKNCQ